MKFKTKKAMLAATKRCVLCRGKGWFGRARCVCLNCEGRGRVLR